MRRLLTGEEIRQLAQEYAEQQRWELVRTCIRQAYGEQAQYVRFALEALYNDEYNYIGIEKVVVCDRHNNELLPDINLPFWQEKRLQWKASYRFTVEDNEVKHASWEMPDILQYLLKDVVYVPYSQSNALQTTSRFRDLRYEYHLDEPPALSFPAVYVDEGASGA